LALQSFDSADSAHLSALVSIWNSACGSDLAINSRFAEYNTRPATGAVQAGKFSVVDDARVAFILASSSEQLGWIDALAVAPAFQRRGIGTELLGWAEEWLRAQGCARFRVGGSLHPFAPGVPAELPSADFFRARGYTDRAGNAAEWDVARDLADYDSRVGATLVVAQIRPARDADAPALLAFLQREFPGRWRFEFEEFLRERGRMSDYIVLWTDRGVDGFARVTVEDSERLLERFYMHRLPKPWGQLGPLGISQDLRGKKYGAALMDATLQHLKSRGVRGCVTDWTSLLDFYSKFGFTPFRKYEMLVKTT